MRNLKFLSLIMLISTTLSAQYRNLAVQKLDVPSLKIVQIDYAENSTFIHFQFTNSYSAGQTLGISEETYVKDKESFRKYKLLNSINLPLGNSNSMAVMDKLNQQHNYTLEFEKFPKTIKTFDIIENEKNGFNFYDVSVDTTMKSKSYLDIGSFISDTPLKAGGSFVNEGFPVIFYNHKGLSITVLLSVDNNYGTYYQAKIEISNRTKRDILFDPSQITAEVKKKKETKGVEVLAYADYMKKINRRQAWAALGNALDEVSNSMNAGYSTSTTQSSASAAVATNSNASGFVGNTYGSVSGSSLTYGAASASSTTVNFDPAVAYAAKKDANSNMEEFNSRLANIKGLLSDNYMKLNTIRSGSDYTGFVNVQYEKAENLLLKIQVNGEEYLFSF